MYNDIFLFNFGLVESGGKIYFMKINGVDFWIQYQSLGFWIVVIGVVYRGVDFLSLWYFVYFLYLSWEFLFFFLGN